MPRGGARALSKFLFKRSFIRGAGLADSDKSVAEESAKALEMLHFPRVRSAGPIYRESQSPRARVSALRALSKSTRSSRRDARRRYRERRP